VTTLTEAAAYGTLEQFLAVYEPGQARTYTDVTGATPLLLALGNTDPVARAAIAHHLLDDGADATAVWGDARLTTLHLLLGHNRHDVAADATLLERLLHAGADINAVAGAGRGTSIQTLAARLTVTDEELAPFDDVLLARPDLDLLRPGTAGRSSLVSARLSRRRRGLAARMEDHLRRHGRWTDDLLEPPVTTTPTGES
jgi:hypothetical protein